MDKIGTIENLTDDVGILVETYGDKVIISNAETQECLMYLSLQEIKPMIKLLEKSYEKILFNNSHCWYCD